MDSRQQAHIAFFLTSRGQETIEGRDLIPTALAPYRDLSSLRYDFPIVLGDDGLSRSLSHIVDGLGCANDAKRHFALQVEREIRQVISRGRRGHLHEQWDKAAGRVKAKSVSEATDVAARIRGSIGVDGELIDCDKAFPGRFVTHAFRRAQGVRAKALRTALNRLILRLEDILRADELNSTRGRSAEALCASMGPAHASHFDFGAMSTLLEDSMPGPCLDCGRRQRIEMLLSVLKRQRFVPLDDHPHTNGSMPYGFEFDSCVSAIEAYRQRLPAAIELSKAMAMAELEAEGAFSESKHEAIFASIGAEDGEFGSERFPSYLVCLKPSRTGNTELERARECLAAGLPFKILVQTDDLVESTGIPGGRTALAMRSIELCHTALAVGGVFVIQTTSASLYRLRETIDASLSASCPSLISVYSGAGMIGSKLSPYLASAAATESRAFPTWISDPSGQNWFERMDIQSNPQAESAWPSQKLCLENDQLQRQTIETRFTALDFLSCEPRLASHFAIAAPESWSDHLSEAPDIGLVDRSTLPDRIPFLFMSDASNRVHKVIADIGMLEEMRRVELRWRSLQELGGIRNSHVERALASREAQWQAKFDELESRLLSAPPPSPVADPAPLTAADAAEAATPTEEAPASETPSDEPWIETARCTTCNECTGINNKMFAYNEDKQAYIADATAGTYAQLVEAAESCQVSIIHPGKPKNPNEPGLEDLLARAAPFQ